MATPCSACTHKDVKFAQSPCCDCDDYNLFDNRYTNAVEVETIVCDAPNNVPGKEGWVLVYVDKGMIGRKVKVLVMPMEDKV